MASLQPHLLCSLFSPASRSAKLLLFPTSTYTSSSTHPALYLLPATRRPPTSRSGRGSFFCFFSKPHAASQISTTDSPRPPFDINLAVILAGFAFEAYTTPPDNIGVKELDAAGCQTVYLSQSFLREMYDGQLFVKLKKGMNFPAMDPWGTSDPYVVLQLDAQVVKSRIKWGTKDPIWNEEFIINIKQDPTNDLQVAAWDANLVTPHKRMGNGRINLEGVFDGNLHEVLVELEGIGGGGMIQLEIKYRSFHDIDEEKQWWEVPFISEFLRKNGLASALASVIGPESIPAGQFVQYAFGKLKSFNDERLLKDPKSLSENNEHDMDIKSNNQLNYHGSPTEIESNVFSADTNSTGTHDSHRVDALEKNNGQLSKLATQFDAAMHSDFWKSFSDVINQNIVQKLGLPVPENLKWDEFELLNKIGLESKKVADAGYIESGLATPDNPNIKNGDESGGAIIIGNIQASLPDIKKTMQQVLSQTDSVFGALIVLTAEKPQSNEIWAGNKIHTDSIEKFDEVPEYSKGGPLTAVTEGVQLDDKKAEEMKALFATAETAMEAWAMLASAVGHPSFVKSEFEKLCFLDNSSTDTQVALWRDSARRRLVVAFRGTEQARWKDLMTDLMLVPAGLNPERIGGDFKQEVQVHSGFLGAYDSVRTRLISLVELSIGFVDNDIKQEHSWKVYVTGHSLGGALATLLALELSSSQLAKRGAISVTMYNFGSPRVGNRRFAEAYNEKVRDSWRVVNHRDIIPTVPRLMGYCHVAQPVYLATGGLKNSLENADLLEDGYQIDVAGEYTPDVLVNEFMKGEKELVEKILQTEINLFRSIRDGSALMQHMEDFYYITLLENVRSNSQTVPTNLV